MIKGLIFDMDGVIVDTAHFHFQSWRKLAKALGSDLSEFQNERLKGVSRRGSLERILHWNNIELSEDEILHWMEVKNNWYLDLLKEMSPADILPGVSDFIKQTKDAGYKLAIGSSSRNTPRILELVQLTDEFDAIVHGGMVEKGKPDPEIFNQGAERMELDPSEVIVFEDAQSGIEAAKAGGFHAVGVGSPEHLKEADFVLNSLVDVQVQDIIKQLTTSISS